MAHWVQWELKFDEEMEDNLHRFVAIERSCVNLAPSRLALLSSRVLNNSNATQVNELKVNEPRSRL